MEINRKKKMFHILVVISTPKLTEKTAEILKTCEIPLQYRFNAQGTAPSEIMDMLGLGSIDKGVLVSMIPTNLSNTIMKKLHKELQLDTVNSGIAFTIPINGMNNLILQMLTRNLECNANEFDGKDGNGMSEIKYALVAAIVNRGFSTDVMEAAKIAGAGGGTVIHSRRISKDEVNTFWGLSVQEEKEIVIIISEVSEKVSIMQSISEKCGMHSEAKGIVISMPIDSVIGI